MTWRCSAAALLITMLASRAQVAAAQSSDATICRGSGERKAIGGRIVDDATGAPMAGVWASIHAQRPDTTFYSDSVVTRGISVTPVFHRRAELDTAGRFCFTDLRAGEYRFEPRAMRVDASHQAVIIHLGKADTLKAVMLRYRRFGRSPEEERAVAGMLRALDDHQRRWAQSRPSHYFLRVRRGCGCLEGPPTTFEMRDGEAVATIDSSGVRHPLSGGTPVRSIESMFGALRATLLDESEWVGAVEYDERFGLPRHYKTGTRTLMTDAWEEMTVERFDVIP